MSHPEPASGGNQLLLAQDVMKRTTLARSTIWRLVKDGDFPAPVRLSQNRIAWPAGAIDAWIASKALAA